MLFACHGTQAVCNFLDQACKCEWFWLEIYSPGFDYRDIQKVIDQPCEKVTADFDIGEVLALLLNDPYIAKVLTDRLRSLGYRVLLADGGKKVLHLLDQHDPQMALLDIAMQDLGGLDVLKEIRGKGRDFPVVMITAYGSIDLAVQAMREGAYDFIAKPFQADHIALVVQGHFREDVYHRLNVILITLPPLRERAEDFPELCQHFFTQFSLEAKRTFNKISGEALEKLCTYDLPGNVRELANVIEQAVVLGQCRASPLPSCHREFSVIIQTRD